MKLENQVCTLEQGREFDKYGLKPVSYWIWLKNKDFVIVANTNHAKLFYEYYNAYSSTELDFLLPYRCEIAGNKFCYYKFRKTADDGYSAGYYSYPENPQINEGIGYTGGNAVQIKSALLLHLLKEKIVDPEDLSL